MGQKQKRIKQKERQDYRQKNKRGDIKKSAIKLTALRFQTEGRHQKSLGLPSGIHKIPRVLIKQAPSEYE